MGFGAPVLDDLSARKVIRTIAPLTPRNYVMMEVKGNLLKDERAEQLKRFKGTEFKKIAKVIVGTPPKEWVEAVHAEILKEKQAKLDAEFEARKKEREKNKVLEERKKAIEERRKKVEEQRKKMVAAREQAAAEKKKN